MSDRVFRFALTLSLTGPPALAAQGAAAWQDSAQRLGAAWQTMRDSLLEGDSTVLEVARREDLVISAPEGLRGSAARALDRLVEVRRRWFGGSGAAPSPSGFRIVLRVQQADGDLSIVVLTGRPDTGAAPRVERMTRRGDLAEALINSYGEMMHESLGPVMGKWLQPSPPLWMPERERRYLTMYMVVTGTGRAQRGCIAGRLADCAYTLGISPPAMAEPGGSYATFVRADLLLTGLEMGGDDAWTRLRTARSDSVGHLLADAAQMPIDSLLARWRAEVLALRPRGGPIRLAIAMLAFGWMAVVLGGTLVAARL